MLTSLIGTAVISSFILYQPFEDAEKGFQPADDENQIINLPEPANDGSVSVEYALQNRRSVRSYSNKPMTISQVSQILWAAQGITTQSRGFRTAPSAGALYPLEVYVIIDNVDELDQGLYKYKVRGHQLRKLKKGEINRDLAGAALGQACIKQAAMLVVFSAVYERTTGKYSDRGERYVHMEAGHAAQNVYLQAESLELGTVVVGAFNDDKVEKLLNMPENETALYILPVGSI